MSDAVIIGVLEALEAKYGRNAVNEAFKAFTLAAQVYRVVNAAGNVAVYMNGSQYEQVRQIAAIEGNKIKAIKVMREMVTAGAATMQGCADVDEFGAPRLGLKNAKEMIESMPGVRPSIC